MGLKKSHRISNFLLHQIACFCGQYIKKKPLKCLYFSGFHDFSFCKSGATRAPSPPFGSTNLMGFPMQQTYGETDNSHMPNLLKIRQ